MPLTHQYLSQLPSLTHGETVIGPSRILELNGRMGINPTSIHTAIRLGGHCLNGPRGTVTLWFFPLEELACSAHAVCRQPRALPRRRGAS